MAQLPIELKIPCEESKRKSRCVFLLLFLFKQKYLEKSNENKNQNFQQHSNTPRLVSVTTSHEVEVNTLSKLYSLCLVVAFPLFSFPCYFLPFQFFHLFIKAISKPACIFLSLHWLSGVKI